MTAWPDLPPELVFVCADSAFQSPPSPFCGAFIVGAGGPEFASARGVSYPAKRFVHIIRSVSDPGRRYVGLTSNLAARLDAHNAGQNRSTARWRPWAVEVCVEFKTEALAVRFERYLKSGAGHAFASRHFADT